MGCHRSRGHRRHRDQGPPPLKDLSFAFIQVGDRVAVRLTRPSGTDKPEEPPEATPEATLTPSPTFREAVSERITVIPSKTTRSHGRVVVTGRAGGEATFLNEDGEPEDADAPEDGDLVEGDDVIFILEDLGLGQGQVICSFERAGEIAAHLEDITAEAEEAGDTRTAERLQDRLDRQLEREEEGLARMLERASLEDRGHVENAQEGGWGRGVGD